MFPPTVSSSASTASQPTLRSAADHRIFVSYAHDDDSKFVGAKFGWVTALLNDVENTLGQEGVRRQNFKFFVDRRFLSPNDSLTEQILDGVRNADLFLAVMSPGYLSSDWCRKECNEFLNAVKERGKSRVFIVRKQPVDRSSEPEEFRDLLGVDFWTERPDHSGTFTFGYPLPNPENPEHFNYYERLQDLCRWLAKALVSISGTSGFSPTTSQPPVTPDKVMAPNSVFLAPVNYDLEGQWDNARRYLDQANVKVVPDTVYQYSREPADFKKQVEAGIAQCDLFVQLLSTIPFRDQEPSTDYAQMQLEAARSAKKTILQWRHPLATPSSAPDPTQSALLDAETVRAESIEDFKQEVRQKAFEKPAPPEPPPPPPSMKVVLVDAAVSDKVLAQQIKQALCEYGAAVVMLAPPESDADPTMSRLEFEENLKQCDALIVVYGQSPSNWVVQQWKQWQKSQAIRKRPATSLGLYDGPPEKDGEVGLPGIYLDCRKGLDRAKLKQFLDEVRGEANQ